MTKAAYWLSAACHFLCLLVLGHWPIALCFQQKVPLGIFIMTIQ